MGGETYGCRHPHHRSTATRAVVACPSKESAHQHTSIGKRVVRSYGFALSIFHALGSP